MPLDAKDFEALRLLICEEINAEIEPFRAEVNGSFDGIDKRITDLQTSVDVRFDQVDQRFNDFQTRVDAQFSEVQTNFDLTPRVQRFLDKLDTTTRRRIEQTLKRMERRPVPSDARFIGRHAGEKVFRHRIDKV